MENKNILLKALPKVDECIALLKNDSSVDAPSSIIKSVVQHAIDLQREKILNGEAEREELTMQQWMSMFQEKIAKKLTPHFKRVVNGTGVVIHTNLGRSILSQKTTDSLVQAGGYYSNLEFNLESGKRGSRYSLVEDIICELTGAEAALVVNNNAAAVLIALDTLAKNKEVVVSRGQLVEIGGSFRIPDVMEKSGAVLREVGATNRTHLYDYERAINENTALLLRVHTSNFRIIGFTSEVSAADMVKLARENNLTTMEDLGSGSLIDLSQFGFPKEPTVQEIVKAGVDVVTFSGDKLLGGPQAGVIVGKKSVIAAIKRNPLNRALRIDKFTLSSLESVLREYFDLSLALENIPTLAMLTISSELLKRRARKIKSRLEKSLADHCKIAIVPTVSRVGGGALPETGIDSWAVDLEPLKMKLSVFEKELRKLAIPIIGRIENERFLLDVRTVQDREIAALVTLLTDFFASSRADKGESDA
ncbi:L-seryl-tRNA(Sec) selenium transferase [Desulfopila sp. IMCC35006]|uniref:L-seryl-tRNA(Sec) selenium transferase n=1 Tax=Desulfopila sp. IMCC35006 TaxID=2569542 RepID=UPI0010AC2C55|nr:L-seryl-tRNA(Sec) selenium transferase [Desulfopila sp. IMCC35006]TKB23206.1 L-seryl-tRNA(Sec) selenium transferase [Desulfopila sp. IMCC35006]